MPTADDILAAALCDDILLVDLESRIINIPSGVKNLGVESDDNVRLLHFRVPRFYCTTDLSEFAIRVNYLNADGEDDVYDVMVSKVDDEMIYFDWRVGRHAFTKRGNVVFSVCMRDLLEDGTIKREFNTTTATLSVLPGLETGTAAVQEHTDIFEQWRAALFGTGNTVEQQIVDAGEVAKQDILDSSASVKQEIVSTGATVKQEVVETGETAKQGVNNVSETAKEEILNTSKTTQNELISTGETIKSEINTTGETKKQEINTLAEEQKALIDSLVKAAIEKYLVENNVATELIQIGGQAPTKGPIFWFDTGETGEDGSDVVYLDLADLSAAYGVSAIVDGEEYSVTNTEVNGTVSEGQHSVEIVD